MAQSDAAAERSALHVQAETEGGPILERDGVAVLRVVQELRDEVVRLREALRTIADGRAGWEDTKRVTRSAAGRIAAEALGDE